MIERERVGWWVRGWMATLVFLTLWLFHWYERVLAPDGGLKHIWHIMASYYTTNIEMEMEYKRNLHRVHKTTVD
jgi:hypothetical protein